LAVVVVELLADDAEEAKRVMDGFKPTIKREEYTGFMKKIVE
jgi:hypothetical protein